jgi:hypothetical protein
MTRVDLIGMDHVAQENGSKRKVVVAVEAVIAGRGMRLCCFPHHLTRSRFDVLADVKEESGE